jgi:hypothetical protein
MRCTTSFMPRPSVDDFGGQGGAFHSKVIVLFTAEEWKVLQRAARETGSADTGSYLRSLVEAPLRWQLQRDAEIEEGRGRQHQKLCFGADTGVEFERKEVIGGPPAVPGHNVLDPSLIQPAIGGGNSKDYYDALAGAADEHDAGKAPLELLAGAAMGRGDEILKVLKSVVLEILEAERRSAGLVSTMVRDPRLLEMIMGAQLEGGLRPGEAFDIATVSPRVPGVFVVGAIINGEVTHVVTGRVDGGIDDEGVNYVR